MPGIFEILLKRKTLLAYGIVNGLLLLLFVVVLIVKPEEFDYVSENNLLEVFTGLTYLFSAVIALYRLVQLGLRRFWGKYFLIPTFGVLSAFDEFSYGQLEADIPYIGEVEINGFHDLLNLARLFVTKNPPAFTIYLLLPFIVPASILLVAFGLNKYLRYRPAHIQKVQRTFLLGNFLVILGSLILTLLIPTDPKNALLLGYSPSRIAEVLFLVFWAAAALFLRGFSDSPWVKIIRERLSHWLKKDAVRRSVVAFLLAGIFLSCAAITPRPFIQTNVYLTAIHVRLLPLLIASISTQVWLLLVILIWHHIRSSKPNADPVEIIPVVFFCLFFILGLAAQLFDLAFLTFEYAFFAEELIELSASITLLFAAIFIFHCNPKIE